jgi:hypothetical protein
MVVTVMLLSLQVVTPFTPPAQSTSLTATLRAPIVFSSQAAGQAASAAGTANPELVGQLAKELGSTPAQAEGAAGALFSVAKSRLSAEDFSKVSAAVPGMDGLLKAAPPATGNPLSQVTGTSGSLGAMAGGLAAATSAFSKLGLSPDMVSKAVPLLTQFVTKSGGSSVGSLLAGALK